MSEQQMSVTPDAVVEEVRAIRRRIWSEAGNDVRRLLERLDRDMPWNGARSPAPDGQRDRGNPDRAIAQELKPRRVGRGGGPVSA